MFGFPWVTHEVLLTLTCPRQQIDLASNSLKLHETDSHNSLNVFLSPQLMSEVVQGMVYNFERATEVNPWVSMHISRARL